VIRLRVGVAASLLATLAILTACACGAPRCVPGSTSACVCADGASGAQTCNGGGSFGVCVCNASGIDGGSADGAATDAGTDGGADAFACRDANIDAGVCPGSCEFWGSSYAWHPGVREGDGGCGVDTVTAYTCGGACDPRVSCAPPHDGGSVACP